MYQDYVANPCQILSSGNGPEARQSFPKFQISTRLEFHSAATCIKREREREKESKFLCPAYKIERKKIIMNIITINLQNMKFDQLLFICSVRQTEGTTNGPFGVSDGRPSRL